MCFIQLYRFMTVYFLSRNLQELGVNQSEILLLTRDKVNIKERKVTFGRDTFPIDDVSAYCLWLLSNSITASQNHLFLTKLA